MYKKVGEHITVDIVGATKDYDGAFYERIFRKIADKAQVHVLEISQHKFEPQGITAVALLSESHMSVHTFPEHGIVSFDFFTCGKVHPRVAIDVLREEIEHTRIVKREFNRDSGESFYHTINPMHAIVLTVGISVAFLIRRIFSSATTKKA